MRKFTDEEVEEFYHNHEVYITSDYDLLDEDVNNIERLVKQLEGVT